MTERVAKSKNQTELHTREIEQIKTPVGAVNDNDGKWAKKHSAKHKSGAALYAYKCTTGQVARGDSTKPHTGIQKNNNRTQ